MRSSTVLLRYAHFRFEFAGAQTCHDFGHPGIGVSHRWGKPGLSSGGASLESTSGKTHILTDPSIATLNIGMNFTLLVRTSSFDGKERQRALSSE
jgi:hypothetical protein